MNSFDIARKVTKTPGIKVDAYIDPITISTRVKNAAKKMLRSGIIVGGYQSRSRMLAEAIIMKYPNSMFVTQSKWGVGMYCRARFSKDTVAQLLELCDAGRMLELAEEVSPGRRDYVNNRWTMCKDTVKGLSKGRFMNIYNSTIPQAMTEVIAASRTPEQIALAEAAAALLDSKTLIRIDLYAELHDVF